MHKHTSKSHKRNHQKRAKHDKVIKKHSFKTDLLGQITALNKWLKTLKFNPKITGLGAATLLVLLVAGFFIADIQKQVESVAVATEDNVQATLEVQPVAQLQNKVYAQVISQQVISELDLKQASALLNMQALASPHIKAYQILVDQKVIGTFKTSLEAQAILDAVKAKAIPQGLKLEAMGYKENVVVQPVNLTCNAFVGYSDSVLVTDTILKGTQVAATHIIKESDTLSGIAQQHNISVEALTAANPGIADQKYLKLGAELKLSAIKPLITITVRGYQSYTEVSKPDVVYEPSKKLYVGEKKLVSKGQEAKKDVTVKVTYENGLVVDKQVVSERITQEMVPAKYAEGTKVKPVATVAASKSGLLSRPASGYIVFSRYGNRGAGFHTGIDLSMPTGSPIYASAAGTVVSSGNQGSYGLVVTIDHGNGIKTVYAHNSKNLVKVGTQVSKGDLIAKSGQTGRATGPHLHFEVRVNNIAVNPEKYLTFK